MMVGEAELLAAVDPQKCFAVKGLVVQAEQCLGGQAEQGLVRFLMAQMGDWSYKAEAGQSVLRLEQVDHIPHI